MAEAVGIGGAEMGQRSARVAASSSSTSFKKLSAEALGTEGTWMPTFGVQGLDVSGHQPNVDWQQQWNMGARFAYVKASEGNYYTNPSYSSQYQGSRNVGMIRGAYHFAIPNWSSGADQARYFVQNGGGWSSDGYTMPPVLDFEFNPYEGRTINGFYFGNTCYNMSPAQLASWVRDFGSTMQSLTGRLPVIYTNTNWWNQCLGNPAGFGDYPLWVAAYPSSPTNNAGPVPTGSWGTYSIWQYSSTGPFAGDSNVWNGDYNSLKAFAGAPATGAFDNFDLTRSGDAVYLRSRGWAVDLAQMSNASPVHIYITGPDNKTVGYSYIAAQPRPDVNAALGYGPSHGFDESIRITTSGTYRACAFAIGTYGNKELGCKSLQAAGVEPPIGSFDSLTQVRTAASVSLRLTGWAVDRANSTSASYADAYITAPDGKTTGYRITANTARADVHSATGFGPNHGFDKLIDVALAGTYKACVFSIGQYTNTPLGCREINVGPNPSPIGSYDSITVGQAPNATTLNVSGWALDPTNPAAGIPVHVYVLSPDGANVGYAFQANRPRSDVNQALATVGDHGFQNAVNVNRTGTYSVCAYAIPIAPVSAGNTALGCKSIEVKQTPAPVGYADSTKLETTSGGASIKAAGWTYDPAVPGASNPVHIYVTSPDGTQRGYAYPTNISRLDVNKAFGISGNHGYSASLAVTQRGRYTVCHYGIGLAEFSTGNTLLGCSSVTY